MRDKVLKAISDFSLIDSGDRIIVALSGGADSVALLHVLNSVKEKYNLTLFAAHINHMIRGNEADDDEKFVTALCENMGIRLFVKRIDVPEISKKEKISLELCGRNVRYEYLSQLADEFECKIATAHTSSDNVETVLYNIARGTLLNGLCGIKSKRDNIIRPLIYCSRGDVECYCADNSLSFVTDSTNLTDEYTRNNIRHNVVPVLEGINSDLNSTFTRMCSSLGDIKRFVDKYSEKELNECRTTYGYSCEKLLNLDKAILFNVLFMILNDAKADASYKHIELISAALTNGGCVDLNNGKRAVCKQGVFRIVDTNEMPVITQQKLKDYGFCQYFSKKELKNVNKNFLNDCVNCDIITDNTVIRTRKEGDTFTLPHRGVTKSLKKLFNELRIPSEKRASLLIVANDNDVLWIEGIGVSEKARVTEDCNGAIRVLRG